MEERRTFLRQSAFLALPITKGKLDTHNSLLVTTMFAIVEISGEQFKISESTTKLRVPYMAGAAEGQEVSLDNVLFSDGSASAKPLATVRGHIRGEKVIVFHKKRRKRYRKTNGHTQRYTELAISW